MKKLMLTTNQRLQLEALLGAQRGTTRDLWALFDLREKLKFSKEERMRYIRSLPDGRALLDEAALEAGPSIEIELEKEEARRLMEVLQTWPNFTVADLDWLRCVRDQLAA